MKDERRDHAADAGKSRHGMGMPKLRYRIHVLERDGLENPGVLSSLHVAISRVVDSETRISQHEVHLKIFGFILLIWSLAIVAHFLWEAWIIAARGIDALDQCRRWWCPHGMRNRWKGTGSR